MAFGIEMDVSVEGNIDFDGMMKRLREVDGKKAEAGIFGGFAQKKAMWNEFGTSRGIPARPFLRNTLYEYEDRWSLFVAPLITGLLEGGSPSAIAPKLGEMMANNIKMTIASGDFAPLAAATIKAKGHAKPLIDTGDMYGSVTHKEG